MKNVDYDELVIISKIIQFVEDEDWTGIPEEERTISQKEIDIAYDVVDRLFKEVAI